MADADATTGPPAAVVLVAHGSRVDAANEAHCDLAGRVATSAGATVLPAFLELASPDIPTALDQAAAAHALVVVLPYFLLPGAHTTRDLPALVAAAEQRWPTTRFRLLPHVGADDALVGLLAAQVDAALR